MRIQTYLLCIYFVWNTVFIPECKINTLQDNITEETVPIWLHHTVYLLLPAIFLSYVLSKMLSSSQINTLQDDITAKTIPIWLHHTVHISLLSIFILSKEIPIDINQTPYHLRKYQNGLNYLSTGSLTKNGPAWSWTLFHSLQLMNQWSQLNILPYWCELTIFFGHANPPP